MKTPTKLIAALVLIAAPVAVIANTDNDRQIEKTARSSYNYKKVLDGNVKVHAENGVVTLTGTVDDRDQKRLAEDTVSDLPGVQRVDNQIVVRAGAPERSDKWIAMKVRGSLLTHANVSASRTNVEVRDGVVYLTGRAENSAQKELTENYAREIEGVRSVDNKIEVVPNADRVDRRDNDTVGETVDDASITSQVKYSLLTHRATSALKTHVTTEDGVVHIRGEADNDSEKSLVTKLAENIRGVRSVDNQMTVAR